LIISLANHYLAKKVKEKKSPFFGDFG